MVHSPGGHLRVHRVPSDHYCVYSTVASFIFFFNRRKVLLVSRKKEVDRFLGNRGATPQADVYSDDLVGKTWLHSKGP